MAKTSSRRAAPRPAASLLPVLPAEQQPRRILIAGAGLLLFGLAVVGIGAGDAGAAITLIGLVLTIIGIHLFGRLGPDER